jgi:putative YphP/YqiW family bacilliredoxin
MFIILPRSLTTWRPVLPDLMWMRCELYVAFIALSAVSPAVALFKDGQLVHMIERHHIEGRSAQMIAHNLIAAFDEYC